MSKIAQGAILTNIRGMNMPIPVNIRRSYGKRTSSKRKKKSRRKKSKRFIKKKIHKEKI